MLRPSGVDCDKDGGLPVAVWIHGGGWVQGSGVDRRYNLSFTVQESVENGTPIIGITLNYRLGAWGYLQGYEGSATDGSNYGLRDQRLALHWIQENIAAFGGDPKKVTIWGQSAGAASVGSHITAYGGRDDGLFRSAIMQSGSPVAIGNQNQTAYYKGAYSNLTLVTGCNSSADSLSCLRGLPYEDLNKVLNTTAFSSIWTPQIDGDIIERHSSEQLADGDFVHVPIIAGANSDEGTSFSPVGINSSAIFESKILSMPQILLYTCHYANHASFRPVNEHILRRSDSGRLSRWLPRGHSSKFASIIPPQSTRRPPVPPRSHILRGLYHGRKQAQDVRDLGIVKPHRVLLPLQRHPRLGRPTRRRHTLRRGSFYHAHPLWRGVPTCASQSFRRETGVFHGSRETDE